MYIGKRLYQNEYAIRICVTKGLALRLPNLPYLGKIMFFPVLNQPGRDVKPYMPNYI